VHFPALERLLRRERLCHLVNRGVTGGGDDLENLRVLLRHGRADETGPGQVAVNRARLVKLPPEINQNEIAFVNDAVATGLRLIMGITAMRTDTDEGRM